MSNASSVKTFLDGCDFYFNNIGKFCKYMCFPVLGQILGTILCIAGIIIYAISIPFLITTFDIFNDFLILVFFALLLVLPGTILLIKSLWEYLIAYGAVNSMTASLVKTGKLYDFNAHTELIKRRSAGFITLWLIISILGIISIIPIFWIIALIAFVYFCLVFQAFVFDDKLSPIGVFKKSFNLVKGHFLSTLGLLIMVGGLTYIVLPGILNGIIHINGIITKFASLFAQNIETSSMFENINLSLMKFNIQTLSALNVAEKFISSVLTFLITGFTLPLRVVCYALWYNVLDEEYKKNTEKKKTKKSK